MRLMLDDPRYFGRFGFVAAIPMAVQGPHHDAGPAFQTLVLPG
jgi:predicted N-acetyltransferase YhbS